MNISIFGLGYVGCVGLGCLSEAGHTVIGVDVDLKKVELIQEGRATIVEKDVDRLIRNNVEQGLIKATASSAQAISHSDVGIICVGTSLDDDGRLDMAHVYAVAKEIGRAIKKRTSFFTVAIRSTVMPGTHAKVVGIIEGESGKRNISDFAVVSNPEFLREGSAVSDFFHPAYTLLASDADQGIKAMKEVYKDIDAEVVVADIDSAELIKFVNNSFHGLKVVFANEIGRICKAVGVNSSILMDLFAKDTFLNISSAYLKPGFAYGGSCLPKDIKALNTIAHDMNVKLPMLSSIELSNQEHIEDTLSMIMSKNKRIIGICGISFKAGTDDLRSSPALELAERLLSEHFDVRIYDENVDLSRIIGTNEQFIYHALPSIDEILYGNWKEFADSLELLVIVNKDGQIAEHLELLASNIEIVDLSGAVAPVLSNATFETISRS